MDKMHKREVQQECKITDIINAGKTKKKKHKISVYDKLKKQEKIKI